MKDSKDERALGALLQRAQQGEAEAFATFMDATIDGTLALARRITTLDRAEDLVANGYLHAWRELRNYDGAKVGASEWFERIVRSLQERYS